MLGTLCAIALVHGRFRGREAISTFLVSPLMLPGLVSGIAMRRLSARRACAALGKPARRPPGDRDTLPRANRPWRPVLVRLLPDRRGTRRDEIFPRLARASVCHPGLRRQIPTSRLLGETLLAAETSNSPDGPAFQLIELKTRYSCPSRRKLLTSLNPSLT